jgi:hypothetical protein
MLRGPTIAGFCCSVSDEEKKLDFIDKQALQGSSGQEPADQHRTQVGHLLRRVQEADWQGGDLRVSRALPVKKSLLDTDVKLNKSF